MDELIITIVLTSVLVFFGVSCDQASCKSQAEKMQMESSWGPIQGCMIQLKDHQWIPLGSYRKVD